MIILRSAVRRQIAAVLPRLLHGTDPACGGTDTVTAERTD